MAQDIKDRPVGNFTVYTDMEGNVQFILNLPNGCRLDPLLTILDAAINGVIGDEPAPPAGEKTH